MTTTRFTQLPIECVTGDTRDKIAKLVCMWDRQHRVQHCFARTGLSFKEVK